VVRLATGGKERYGRKENLGKSITKELCRKTGGDTQERWKYLQRRGNKKTANRKEEREKPNTREADQGPPFFLWEKRNSLRKQEENKRFSEIVGTATSWAQPNRKSIETRKASVISSGGENAFPEFKAQEEERDPTTKKYLGFTKGGGLKRESLLRGRNARP